MPHQFEPAAPYSAWCESVVEAMDSYNAGKESSIHANRHCCDCITLEERGRYDITVPRYRTEQLPLELNDEPTPPIGVCHSCNEIIPHDSEDHGTCEDDLLCEGCYQSDAGFCEGCEESAYADNLTAVHASGQIRRNAPIIHVCESCRDDSYRHCSDCSDWFHADDVQSDDNTTLCQRCYENYFWCEGCESICHCDRVSRSEDRALCDSCYEEEDDTPATLHSYSYKPRIEPQYVHSGSDHATIEEPIGGFELEIESGGKCSQEGIINAVEEHLGSELFYCKEDSSIVRGVEVVSQPHALKKMPFKALRAFCKDVRKQGARSYESGNCGLHVHIGRAAYGITRGSETERTIWRGYRALTPYLKAVSGRERYYSGWPEAFNPRYAHLETYRFYDGHGRASLNVCPEHTIEWRFFRGTLQPESCVNSIKFCFYLTSFLVAQSASRMTLIERGKRSPSVLWFDLLNSMPEKLRGWALKRSAMTPQYNEVARTMKNKARIPHMTNNDRTEGIEEACA